MKKRQCLCICLWLILLSALPTVAYVPHDENVTSEIGKNINSLLKEEADVFSLPVLNDQIDQQQETSCGEGIRLSNASWYYAQSFRPTLGILTRAELFLGKRGDLPEDLLITVSIRDSLYRNDLTTASINGSGITDEGTWLEFNFTYLGVEQGRLYYIILCINRDMKDNEVLWFFDVNDPYPSGETYVSENDGQSWHSLEKPYGFPNKDFCFKTYGLPNQAPNKPILPHGETKGHYGAAYNYTTTSLDGDGNMLYYLWDWGDGTTSGWLGPFNSGVTIKTSHTWMIKGSYLIKVKAKDIWNFESAWSDPLTVRMNKNKGSPSPCVPFFQWYGQHVVRGMLTLFSLFL